MNKIKVILIIIVVIGLLWFFSALFSDISKESLVPEVSDNKVYEPVVKEITVFGNYTNTSLFLKVLYPDGDSVLTFYVENGTIDYLMIDSALNRIKEDFLNYYRSRLYEE